MMQVCVVTLVQDGEVTSCKVFEDRKQAIEHWHELSGGDREADDEVRISIEDVVGFNPTQEPR